MFCNRRLGKILAATLLLASVTIAVGCGGRSGRVPVGGVVTVDGKPLEFGDITFLPIKGGNSEARAGGGSLSEGGNYQLSSYTPNDGLVRGKYQVYISATEPMGETAQRWHAPKKYASAQTSGLTAEITEENQELNFELSWDGEKPREPFVEKFQ